ncbi:hypothetical protein PENTCL1PPCAC_4012, partial [Pristionchus entomophagus]
SSICLVCSSPSAHSLHFGARTCKACAAFFRRTISMGIHYACTSVAATVPCSIHYHLRMICRACRYEKCLGVGMKEGMVQRKLDENNMSSPPKHRKGINKELRASSSYGARGVNQGWKIGAPDSPQSACYLIFLTGECQRIEESRLRLDIPMQYFACCHPCWTVK